MYNFSKRSLARMDGVHPELQLVFKEAIKVSPLDFGIPLDGGVRTAERQNELYNRSASKCDGYEKLSRHQIRQGEQFGTALDVYAFVNGKASWKEHHINIIAGVIISTANRLYQEGKISIRIYWGGQFGTADFDGWDKVHFEVAKV